MRQTLQSNAGPNGAQVNRTRDLLMRERTMLLNAVRGHLAVLGIIAPQGPGKALELIAQLREGAHEDLS